MNLDNVQTTGIDINMSKGISINLSKADETLEKVAIGLGWLPNQSNPIDLDLSAILINQDGLIQDAKDFLFHKNGANANNSAVHSGDDTTGDNCDGEEDGDDEVITLDLKRLPNYVKGVVFIANIHAHEQRKQTFKDAKESYLRAVDAESGQVLGRYQLEDEFASDIAVEFAHLSKDKNGDWSFTAVGEGDKNGIESIVTKYGINPTN